MSNANNVRARENYGVSPIDIEVMRYKLEGIANEMESTLLRSSFSPVVKEAMDASASLFTLQGETLAQASAVPIHLSTLIPVVNVFLREFPVETMKAGDLYIMNDPYLGGTHLPDIALVAPIFSGDELIALAATMTHHQDVGGMTPGSIPTNATEIFQEGIRIPPLKFADGGVLNETLIKLLRLNVRMPDTFLGDLNAQVAACRIGGRRISELVTLHGRSNLNRLFEAIFLTSQRMTVARLSAIPNGTYRYVDYLDNDGIELDRCVRIEVAVTLKDGSFHVDFTGTSAQLKGPFNVVESGCLAAAYFAVRALTGDDIPTNAGCFRTVTLHRPEGTLVRPIEPAPVGSRTATIKRITCCIVAAFRDVLPEIVPADSAGVLFGLIFAGRFDCGNSYIVGDIIVGGSGASAHSDGVDVIETDATNGMNLPVEAFESEAPIRIRRLSLRCDSGGDGQHRGGLGLVKEYEFLGAEASFTYRGERHYRAAGGAAGGEDGACASAQIIRAAGGTEEIRSKIVTTLHRGDRVAVLTPGGGGYGSPRQRSRIDRAADLESGKTTSDELRTGPS
jgi:N-methylhydantoinase B